MPAPCSASLHQLRHKLRKFNVFLFFAFLASSTRMTKGAKSLTERQSRKRRCSLVLAHICSCRVPHCSIWTRDPSASTEYLESRYCFSHTNRTPPHTPTTRCSHSLTVGASALTTEAAKAGVSHGVLRTTYILVSPHRQWAVA
jgi:hypothetical protein